MADISKIQVPGSATQYNIKDAQARRDIEDVKADLGTLTDLDTDNKTSIVAAINELASGGSGLTDEAKAALLACFESVVWKDGSDNGHYAALESALYPDQYPKITAVFDSGSTVIYTDDTLDSLKQYLTVKYYETSESSGTTIADADYTLSGSLVAGTNNVTVTYNDNVTLFTVSGVVDFYNTYEWSLSNGNMQKIEASCDQNTNALTGLYISYASTRPTVANRRTIVTSKGVRPYTDYIAGELATDYPIPIPKDANQIKVSITPNTQYSYINIEKYDEGTGKYTNYDSSVKGWTQGENTKTFTASEDLFATINFKYDSSGSSYPVEPTEITIEFSEV